MKKLNYILSAVVIMAVLVTVGCGGDEPGVPAEEVVTENFSKTWVLSSVTLGGTTIDDMTGFTLTITANKGYTTNSSSVDRDPTPWPGSGTWGFNSEITDKATSQFAVTRDDGLVVDVTLGESTLALEFTFDEDTHTSGKQEAVEGNWVMNFTAQ